MNENFELENMRQQMNTLKKKLEQQEIVNERMIHKSMKRTTSNIMRRYYAIMALCLLMIPYTYVVFIMSESLSMNFWIGTTILMLICGGATYYNSLNVSKSDMMSGNLVEVGHHMARAKKFDANWLFFGIPAVIAWLLWLTWELSQKYSDATQYMIYGIVCGAVIGAICGINTHLKTQRQYQEVIDQIEDLTRE
jgi:hypothetical protein